jgi:hypothetical protein
MQAVTFAQGLPVLTWYTYGDYADPTGANQEAWFGFFRPDNTPKPSYAALRTFASVFRGTRFTRDRSHELGLPAGKLNLGGRGFALAYAGADRRVTALWLANESVAEGQGRLPDGGSVTPKNLRVELPVDSPAVTIVDYLGPRRTVTAQAGKVALTIGPGPQYVVEAVRRPAGARQLPRLRVHLTRSCRHRTLHVSVEGPDTRHIARTTYYLDGHRLPGRSRHRRIPRRYLERGRAHRLRARVTAGDGRRARLARSVHACAGRARQPRYTG